MAVGGAATHGECSGTQLAKRRNSREWSWRCRRTVVYVRAQRVRRPHARGVEFRVARLAVRGLRGRCRHRARRAGPEAERRHHQGQGPRQLRKQSWFKAEQLCLGLAVDTDEFKPELQFAGDKDEPEGKGLCQCCAENRRSSFTMREQHCKRHCREEQPP